MCITDILTVQIIYAAIIGIALGFIGKGLWKKYNNRKQSTNSKPTEIS